MQPNILFVEDEEDLRMTVGDGLRSEGYLVDYAVDGDQGFEKATHLPFDLIVLDLMLPRRDGLTVCRDIRQAGLGTPILMLTARGHIADKVTGLKTGADDYVTKPFNMQELMARIEALLRRAPSRQSGQKDFAYQFGSVRVDRRATEVTRDGTLIDLSAREFQLLLYFIDHAGETLSRRQLLTDVWGYDAEIYTRTVDVHVGSLRRKLQGEGDPGTRAFIQTVQRLGYKFHPVGDMRVSLGERALATALLVPTAMVVIVLAALQYQWSNQVSNATSVRLADSLQMSMMNWHLNFFRDLSDISFRLRIDAAAVGPAELAELSRRFQAWRSSAPYPDVVSALYVMSGGGGLRPALRFDSSKGHFEVTPRPPELEGLWSHLEQTAATASPARMATLDDTSAELDGWRFDPQFLALVHPFSAAAGVLGALKEASAESAGWLILELSADTIRTRVFPELSNRYFTGIDGLDYQVAVVTETRPRRVLYSSDPGFVDQDPVDADGRLSLFGRPIDKTSGSPLYVFHRPSANTGLSASMGTAWFPLVQQTGAEEDWQLVVRHRRGGPLGAFVAGVHRRDLAVSFGVLLLLVVSMTMWIIVSNRAQRLARLQMAFVSAVSHELRTPLTIIASAADNITEGIVHEQQQLAQYGAVISNQARRLSELVEQVLLFASAREAPPRYQLRPLDISEVIDSTLTASLGLMQAPEVVVERRIEPNLPLVMGDPLAVSQCLQNLITNALKYGSQQRWLGIRAVCTKSADSAEIQISVSDHGVGITASDLPHIFKPFYRSPSVASAQIHGTGLGLTIARSIAEAMNGQLTVTTTPGFGSTFTLHLPGATEVALPADGLAAHVVAQ